jgi:1,4-dihydroxy-2-naphthoate octaprenyltransferase
MVSERLKAWIQASRPPFFIATLIPLATGWVLAGDGGWQRFLLVIAGSLMVHLATNLANDYFEYAKGTDAGDAIGGSRVIQEGKLSPRDILLAITVLYFCAFLVAFYLMTTLSLYGIAPLIFFAFLSSLFYVGPPVRYGYHGLGELLVGINMGPIMVVGTYWVMAGHPAWRPFWVSLPIGLMVASILYYQSLPDMKTDRDAGKLTLAVRLGRKRAFVGLIIFYGLIFGSTTALVLSGVIGLLALLGLLGIPLFGRLLSIMRRTEDWLLLDQYGKYVRTLYFINGLAIIAGAL